MIFKRKGLNSKAKDTSSSDGSGAGFWAVLLTGNDNSGDSSGSCGDSGGGDGGGGGGGD